MQWRTHDWGGDQQSLQGYYSHIWPPAAWRQQSSRQVYEVPNHSSGIWQSYQYIFAATWWRRLVNLRPVASYPPPNPTIISCQWAQLIQDIHNLLKLFCFSLIYIILHLCLPVLKSTFWYDSLSWKLVIILANSHGRFPVWTISRIPSLESLWKASRSLPEIFHPLITLFFFFFVILKKVITLMLARKCVL